MALVMDNDEKPVINANETEKSTDTKSVGIIEKIKNLKPEDLKYRYYDGEEENPYEDNDPRSTFWTIESLSASHDPKNVCEKIKKYVDEIPTWLLTDKYDPGAIAVVTDGITSIIYDYRKDCVWFSDFFDYSK